MKRVGVGLSARQSFYEVEISFQDDNPGIGEIVTGLLINSGVKLEAFIEQKKKGVRFISFYCSSLRQAQKHYRRIKSWNSPALKVRIRNPGKIDWLTRWKKDWKPIKLTKRLDVVPVWCQKQYKPGKKEYLLLDTVCSFGTGLHETTRFMAEFIESLSGQFISCLDVGTGTGILAMVALKNQAKTVYALDVDRQSIQTARANFKANDMSRIRLFQSDVNQWSSPFEFDLVCANLITHDLIEFKQKILSFVKPGGWLAVSGISIEKLSVLRWGFSELPLRCVKVKKGKQWTALLFKKRR